MHDKPLPVLIYNRGGNGSFGTMVFGTMMNNLFPVADQGFVIIGSQYRRSNSKYKLLDEFGGKDVNDVVALQKFIPAIVGADSSKVGMYGASRGSMQTFLALKKMNNIKAVASIAGVSDLLKGLEYRPEMENVYKKRIPLYEKNKTSELQKRSVLRWVDQLPSDVPVLLLHGTKDKRVSVNHSITLAKAFSKTGVPHKLVLYAGDSHGLRNNKAKSHKEIANWFKQHL
ncbi:alpha/beta hydrolase family protein [Pseudoalteromonas luteoviolacea]|uniref:alpha/beta hydrolase family protein n=1 Tax=Pseudoalteromonas luteoviolacea TaxID=43657 RepID=UPI00314511BA